MRTSTIFALLAVALTAVLAAPHQPSSNNKAVILSKQIQPTIRALKSAGQHLQESGDLEDLIDFLTDLLDVDVRAILDQALLTQAEIKVILTKALTALTAAVALHPIAAVKLGAIVTEAYYEGIRIANHFITTILLGFGIDELIEVTINDIEALIESTNTKIKDVLTGTALGKQIQKILKNAEGQIVAAVQAFLDVVLAEINKGSFASSITSKHILSIVAAIQPKSIQAVLKHNNLTSVADLGELINFLSELFSVDVQAIIDQVALTKSDIKAAIAKAVKALAATALLYPIAVARLTAILYAAYDGLGSIISNFMIVIAIGIGIEDLVEETIENTIALIETTFKKLEDLAAGIAGKKVLAILKDAETQIKNAIKSLTDLLSGIKLPSVQLLIEVVEKYFQFDLRPIIDQAILTQDKLLDIFVETLEALYPTVGVVLYDLNELIYYTFSGAFAEALWLAMAGVSSEEIGAIIEKHRQEYVDQLLLDLNHAIEHVGEIQAIVNETARQVEAAVKEFLDVVLSEINKPKP